MMEAVTAKWATLSSNGKRNTIFGAIGAVVIGGAIIGSGSEVAPVIASKNESEQGAFVSPDQELTFSTLSTQVANLTQQVDILNQRDNSTQTTVMRLEELLSNLSDDDDSLRTLYETNKRLSEMERKLKDVSNRPVEYRLPDPDNTSPVVIDDVGFIDDPDYINDPFIDSAETPDDVVEAVAQVVPEAPEREFQSQRPVINDNSRVTRIPSDPLQFVQQAINGEVNTALPGEENIFIDADEDDTGYTDSIGPGYRGPAAILTMTDEVAKEEEAKRAREQVKHKGKRVLAGSSIKAVLINGVDAPTGIAAQEGAVAAILRVSDHALLPNNYRVNLEGCIITAAIRGDSATERANFRTDRLTCKFAYGDVDIPIQGYVSGKDGVAGIRGKLINKQGKALLYGTITGVTGGIGEAFGGSNNSNNNVIVDDPYALPDSNVVGLQATRSSVTNASEFLTEYYSKKLDELYEVIEVKPLIEVTVHVLRTFEMTLMDETEEQTAR